MGKEEFFSKLNIKDYNNELEKVLEKKSFSEETKNILLNILYKIEIAYEDYTKVKVKNKAKKEILEEIIKIIEKKCKEIEIVKPKLNEKTKLGDKKFIVEKQSNKIISYPNEKTIFYGICKLGEYNIVIDKKYEILKEPMEDLLNAGFIMEQQEIIRDFDGWSWNISGEEIENHIYNLVYQNIRILVGEKFLSENISSFPTVDILDKLEKRIRKICDEDIANNIITEIYRIAILENINRNKYKKDSLFKVKKDFEEELTRIENKKLYLQEIATKKKKIGKQIKKIDEIINNNKVLRQEFENENSKLKEKEKIFSLSEYSEILIEKRKKLIGQLRDLSALMKPMNYVKMKTELKNKIEILKGIDFERSLKQQINTLAIQLQNNFLNALNEKIIKLETKKDIIDYIYLFRYYKLLKIDSKKQIQNTNELTKKIINTEKNLVTRGCNLKAMNIISNNIEENYKIISRVLSSNIIDLEDIQLEFKKKDDKILLNIYDDSIIDNTIEYDNKVELNVKFNKKIKLFN